MGWPAVLDFGSAEGPPDRVLRPLPPADTVESLHEQLAVRAFPRVFSFSPNRRFEPLALRHTGRHPVELPQPDSEVRGDSHEDAIRLGESF